MKTLRYLIALSIYCILLSCEVPEKIKLDQTTVFANDEIIIHVSEKKHEIVFRIESLKDTINNQIGNFDKYAIIAFDINNNGKVDRDVDFGFGSQTQEGIICPFLFKDNNRLSACGALSTAAIFPVTFEETYLFSQAHIVWELTISKLELKYNPQLDFIVKISRNNNTYTYPTNNFAHHGSYSFDGVLSFVWEELE